MFFRMIFGLPGAAFITALLFLAMGWMVRMQDVEIIDPPPLIDSILPKIKDSDPDTGAKLTRPTTPEAPPPIKTETTRTPLPGVPDPGPLPGPGIEGGTISLPPLLTPTVRIPPAYPESCAVKGVEGAVTVEFDVTPEGMVANPRIIASSNSCFDRAVMRAIVNWKYSPQTDSDGRPIMRRGVRETLVFELTD